MAITRGHIGALQGAPFKPESRIVLRWNLAFKMWNQVCWLPRLEVSKRLRGNRRRICRRRGERVAGGHFSGCSLNCAWSFQRYGAVLGTPEQAVLTLPAWERSLMSWSAYVLQRFGELHPRWPECFRHLGCSYKKVPTRVIPAVLAGARVALELPGCRCMLGSP